MLYRQCSNSLTNYQITWLLFINEVVYILILGKVCAFTLALCCMYFMVQFTFHPNWSRHDTLHPDSACLHACFFKSQYLCIFYNTPLIRTSFFLQKMDVYKYCLDILCLSWFCLSSILPKMRTLYTLWIIMCQSFPYRLSFAMQWVLSAQ